RARPGERLGLGERDALGALWRQLCAGAGERGHHPLQAQPRRGEQLPMNRLIFSAVPLFLLALTACVPRTVDPTGCTKDGDCANAETCDVATGFCLCVDDTACDAREVCNDLGRCQ